MATGFEGFHGDAIAANQVRDSRADLNDFTAQLMAENDRILDTGEGMRRGAGRDGPA
jgi:hypothetical protein